MGDGAGTGKWGGLGGDGDGQGVEDFVKAKGMRIRTIKPQFFVNEEMAKCNPLARLAFIGLICAADLEGRLEDRPARLKIEILPYDDADMDGILSELETRGFIRRYEVDGRRFIWVVKFKEHQRITGSEADRISCYPPCNEDSPVAAKSVAVSGKTCAPPKFTPDDPEFNAFWKAYPRKVGKGAAEKAWGKNGRPELAVLLAAVAAQAQSEQWQKDGGKFIPHPATWLNQKRWEDEGMGEIPVGPNIGVSEKPNDGKHRTLVEGRWLTDEEVIQETIR